MIEGLPHCNSLGNPGLRTEVAPFVEQAWSRLYQVRTETVTRSYQGRTWENKFVGQVCLETNPTPRMPHPQLTEGDTAGHSPVLAQPCGAEAPPTALRPRVGFGNPRHVFYFHRIHNISMNSWDFRNRSDLRRNQETIKNN